MTGYVINPWFFYWLQIVNALSIFTWIIGAILLIIIVIWWIYLIAENDETVQNAYIRVKKGLFTAIGICILAILIPSEKTLIRMELAKHVTYENVEIFLEDTKKAADYIIDQIKK